MWKYRNYNKKEKSSKHRNCTMQTPLDGSVIKAIQNINMKHIIHIILGQDNSSLLSAAQAKKIEQP